MFEIECSRYVQFCIKMVKMFLQYDIKLILVFDGADLPAKEGTNTGRSTYGLCCSFEYIVIEKKH